MFSRIHLLAALCWVALVSGHTVITYPGWRGDNLHTNGTLPQHNAETIGVDFLPNGSLAFPYGMQWIYPCGGMPLTHNRSFWPVSGGAVSIQPGWFQGHSKALFYVNIGIQGPGEVNPPNMSHPVVPPFQILGPTNQEYAGQFCLPQVPMPTNVTLQVGQNVTLQVVEVAQHGAALYSCADLTLVANNDPRIKKVTPQNCYNSTDISFELVFTTAALTNAAPRLLSAPSATAVVVTALVTVMMWLQ